MLSPDQFLGFLLAAALITASPGPDNLMVLGMGISKGRRYGVAFGLGCALGCLSHTALAVIGVSALVAASPLAFTLLKIGGGLYLVWLGVQALRSSGATRVGEAGEVAAPSMAGLFWRGVFANAINPKVVLFFLSFLPQFIRPDDGRPGLQALVLGLHRQHNPGRADDGVLAEMGLRGVGGHALHAEIDPGAAHVPVARRAQRWLCNH